MARRADPKRVRKLYDTVQRHPGHRKGFFARLLNWHRQQVERAVVHTEEKGLLLYEDDEGKLWPVDGQ